MTTFNKIGVANLYCIILCSLILVSLVMFSDFRLDSVTKMVFAQGKTTSSLSTSPSTTIQSLELSYSSNPLEISDQPFYVESTKSSNMRVLNVDNIPTVEVSYTGNSTINGAPTQTIGTIIDKMGAGGSVHSEGQAIILTATGQVITYKSESIGYYNPDGSFSDSGIILFSIPFHGSTNNVTALQSEKDDNNSYLEFNNVLGIYKKTVDPSGKGLTKVWKWG
ncbi:MAG TPA: hypothetical protein VD815_10850 [Candidatus Saccharimonadales bacterium]|nr:hypothetical protein [Candidatus Saccharimonadales bacterium]